MLVRRQEHLSRRDVTTLEIRYDPSHGMCAERVYQEA